MAMFDFTRKGAPSVPYSSVMDMSGDEFSFYTSGATESKKQFHQKQGTKRRRTDLVSGSSGQLNDKWGDLFDTVAPMDGDDGDSVKAPPGRSRDGLGSIAEIVGSGRRWIVPRYHKQPALDKIHGMGQPGDVRRQMQILGRAITDPIQRQSNVVVTLRGMKTQYENIVKHVPDMYQLVPAGDPADFKFEAHMIWIVPLKPGHMPSRSFCGTDVPQLNTGIISTVVMNGLDTRGEYAVGGLTQTYRDQNNKESDDLSTGVIRGLESTRHTGPGRFTPGMTIGVSFTPNVMYDDRGRAVPMVKYEEFSDTTMLPQTFPLSMLSACQQPARFRGRIDAAIAAVIRTAEENKSMPGAINMCKAIESAITLFRADCGMNDISDRLPIYSYGYWYTLEQLFQFPVFFMAIASEGKAQGDLTEFAAEVHKLLSKAVRETDSCMYIAQRNQYLPGVVDREGRDVVSRFIALLNGWKSNGTVTAMTAAWEDVQKFLAYCRSMQDHTTISQVDYNKNHSLGRAMNVCDSGQQVECDLRPGV